MSKYFFVIAFVFFVFSVNAQETYESNTKGGNVVDMNKSAYSFVPVKKLQNSELWQRVSEYRFECVFLRLAVEWDNFEYVLLEMDGRKRVLARDRNYAVITQMIIKLTLNEVPNLSGN